MKKFFLILVCFLNTVVASNIDDYCETVESLQSEIAVNAVNTEPGESIYIHGTMPKEDSNKGLIKTNYSGGPKYSFEWSGELSEVARTQDAKILADGLQKLYGKGTRNIQIYAHSHGGNVALEALKILGDGYSGLIKDLVLLGTPFYKRSNENASIIKNSSTVSNIRSFTVGEDDVIQGIDIFSNWLGTSKVSPEIQNVHMSGYYNSMGSKINSFASHNTLPGEIGDIRNIHDHLNKNNINDDVTIDIVPDKDGFGLSLKKGIQSSDLYRNYYMKYPIALTLGLIGGWLYKNTKGSKWKKALAYLCLACAPLSFFINTIR